VRLPKTPDSPRNSSGICFDLDVGCLSPQHLARPIIPPCERAARATLLASTFHPRVGTPRGRPRHLARLFRVLETFGILITPFFMRAGPLASTSSLGREVRPARLFRVQSSNTALLIMHQTLRARPLAATQGRDGRPRASIPRSRNPWHSHHAYLHASEAARIYLSSNIHQLI